MLLGQASCVVSTLLCLVTSFVKTIISIFAKRQKPQSLVLILVCSLSTHSPGELSLSKALNTFYADDSPTIFSS